MEINRKYELTNETIVYGGRTLHRIKALRSFGVVKAGELGGWVQSENNLSHEGNCWIYDEAKALDNSRVEDNARMYNHSVICDNVELHDNSAMCDNTVATDNAQMHNNAKMHNNAEMHDGAMMFDNSVMYDHSKMFDNTELYDNSRMCNSSQLCDNSAMFDDSVMYGYSAMLNNANLKRAEVLYGTLSCKVDKFIDISNPDGQLITGVLINGEILYNVGSQTQMTRQNLISKVCKKNGKEQYLKILAMIELYLR